MHFGITHTAAQNDEITDYRFEERTHSSLYLVAHTPEIGEPPNREVVHIDRDRGRQISTRQGLLGEHQVENIAAATADLLRRHNCRVTRGFHRRYILEREAVFAVMLGHARLE